MTEDAQQVLPYEEWPPMRQSREQLARDVFGRYIVAYYDGWLDIAHEMLTQGYRLKPPTEQQKRYFDWIDTLSDQDKENAFEFVRQIANGVVFSILNEFDGTSGGSVINTDEYFDRLQINVDIFRQNWEDNSDKMDKVESIPINAEVGIDLHEAWFVWLNRYSRGNELIEYR